MPRAPLVCACSLRRPTTVPDASELCACPLGLARDHVAPVTWPRHPAFVPNNMLQFDRLGEGGFLWISLLPGELQRAAEGLVSAPQVRIAELAMLPDRMRRRNR